MQKYERRKHKRFPIQLELKTSKLFKQDYICLEDVNADISLIDISRTGIGFSCAKQLPLNYYFDAKIIFGEKEYFYCVIKILRYGNVDEDGRQVHGAEFVGLAPFLADKVDEYGKALDRSCGEFYN